MNFCVSFDIVDNFDILVCVDTLNTHLKITYSKFQHSRQSILSALLSTQFIKSYLKFDVVDTRLCQHWWPLIWRETIRRFDIFDIRFFQHFEHSIYVKLYKVSTFSTLIYVKLYKVSTFSTLDCIQHCWTHNWWKLFELPTFSTLLDTQLMKNYLKFWHCRQSILSVLFSIQFKKKLFDVLKFRKLVRSDIVDF